MPVFIDFTLSFLLAHARIEQLSAYRRLNAFENTVVALARRWRQPFPLVADREIRIADGTREALLYWIGVERESDARTVARLAAYAACVTDQSVPPGWIRLCFSPER